jgi:hypothetical protein
MKCALFSDVTAIQVRVTAVQRSIPKAAFAYSFQKLYERLVCYLLGVSAVSGLYWPTFWNMLSVPISRQMIWK